MDEPIQVSQYKEGDRIEIPLQKGRYKFTTPKIPNHTEFLNDGEEGKECYYKRFLFPSEESWQEFSLEEKKAFRDREIKRRLFGCWFWNYNPKLDIAVPTYLTGHNYFYLQYFKIPKAGYPKHRKFQREFFYFINLVENNADCDGEAVAKTRRGGITGIYSAIDLNIATTTSEIDILLQNKSLDDAKKVNLYNIAFALDYIPYLEINGEQALLPKASKITATQIIFGLPRTPITSGKGSIEAEKKRKMTKAMNSRIIVLATTKNKDDTYSPYRTRKDEISKYEKNSVKAIHENAILAIKRDGAAFGKMSLFSSSFEEDSENFLEWRDIYLVDSNVLKLLPNGKTKSGLWSYFISAVYAMNDAILEKEGRQLFDEFGECDEEYAENYIRANFYTPYASDPRQLQAKKREYPINESDAFNLGNASSTYDPIHLNEALMNIEQLEQRHELHAGRYKLDWIMHNREVIERQDDDGLFEFTYNVPKEFRNNIRIGTDSRIMPDHNTPFIICVDPTSYTDQVKGGGSKNAICGGSLPDARIIFKGDNPANGGNVIHVIYHGRPKTTEIFEDDVKKLIIFLGAYCYIEKNKEWLAVNLVKAGYGRFLLVKDEKNNFRAWTPKDKTAGGWTDRELINAYIRATEQYIQRPQLFPDGTTGKDYLLTIRNRTLIKQLIAFDPTNTEAFDLAVAFQLWCCVAAAFQRVKPQYSDGGESQFIRAFYGWN